MYGGDILLSRFVCALDYLLVMQARPQSGSTIVEAYAIAANLPSDSEAARKVAAVAWAHDAVQSLTDRLRYRSKQEAGARITTRLTALIEEMLLGVSGEDVSLKDKAEATKAALSFVRMVSDQDIQERVERTKRGFAKARATLSEAEVEVPTSDQAELYLKILVDQLGKDKVKALLE